jgi:hypothetical protein
MSTFSLAERMDEFDKGGQTMLNLKTNFKMSKISDDINSFSEFKELMADVLMKGGMFTFGIKVTFFEDPFSVLFVIDPSVGLIPESEVKSVVGACSNFFEHVGRAEHGEEIVEDFMLRQRQLKEQTAWSGKTAEKKANKKAEDDKGPEEKDADEDEDYPASGRDKKSSVYKVGMLLESIMQSSGDDKGWYHRRSETHGCPFQTGQYVSWTGLFIINSKL